MNKKVNERYGEKAFHTYIVASGGASNSLKTQVKNQIRIKPRCLLNSSGLRKFAKYFTKGLSFSVQFGGIWGFTNQFNSYLKYQGNGLYVSISGGLTASFTIGDASFTVSGGISSSRGVSVTTGYVRSYFTGAITNYLRTVSGALENTVKKRAPSKYVEYRRYK